MELNSVREKNKGSASSLLQGVVARIEWRNEATRRGETCLAQGFAMERSRARQVSPLREFANVICNLCNNTLLQVLAASFSFLTLACAFACVQNIARLCFADDTQNMNASGATSTKPKANRSFSSRSSDAVGATTVHYRVDAHDLREGLPPLSSHHDGRFYSAINRTGLVKTWHFWAHTLTTNGRWMAGATVLFFSAGSVSLDLQMFVPLCYASAMWALALFGFVAVSTARRTERASCHARGERTNFARRIRSENATRVGTSAHCRASLAAVDRSRSRRWRIFTNSASGRDGARDVAIASYAARRVAVAWLARGKRCAVWLDAGCAKFSARQHAAGVSGFCAAASFGTATGRSHHAGGVALVNASAKVSSSGVIANGAMAIICATSTGARRRVCGARWIGPWCANTAKNGCCASAFILDTCADYPIDKTKKIRSDEANDEAFESAVLWRRRSAIIWHAKITWLIFSPRWPVASSGRWAQRGVSGSDFRYFSARASHAGERFVLVGRGNQRISGAGFDFRVYLRRLE